MNKPARPTPDLSDDDAAAELAALTAAVEASLADPRPSVPNAEVRAWLLEIASGDLGAPPPETK